jgi:eukaryotic-like serine/threonine-protein kinase
MDVSERSLPAQIGRYQILRLLGRGAMGRVLLAHDPVLDRDVAVKLLRDDLKIPPEQRRALFERMKQEARASARVSHPNIVALHDMGEDAELGLFLVFEYADGETLKHRIAQRALGAAAAAKLAREIGDALTTAHAAGVLHRDIKPENIILTPTGGKIADFGIARVPDSTLTRDGGLLGTPAYSAPECIVSGKFSPLSDQFSLAATLYEAIGQRRAFPGEDAVAVATRITTEDAPGIAELAGVDPHVDRVLARGLSKDPSRRFDDARAFGQALAEALEQGPRSVLPTLPDAAHQRRGADGHGTRNFAGGVALGALLGIAGLQISLGLREPERGFGERLAAPDAGSDARPIGWLSEAAKPRARPQPSARKDAREALVHDAGTRDASLATSDPTDAARAAASGDADRAADPTP